MCSRAPGERVHRVQPTMCSRAPCAANHVQPCTVCSQPCAAAHLVSVGVRASRGLGARGQGSREQRRLHGAACAEGVPGTAADGRGLWEVPGCAGALSTCGTQRHACAMRSSHTHTHTPWLLDACTAPASCCCACNHAPRTLAGRASVACGRAGCTR